MGRKGGLREGEMAFTDEGVSMGRSGTELIHGGCGI